MKAMVLEKIGSLKEDTPALRAVELPDPAPAEKEILVKVTACGVCHTDMDEIEGRTPPPELPVIPGHQVVGTVERNGRGAGRFRTGDRVGIAWIHSACGKCRHCLAGEENLCDDFRATGRDANGGYAEYTTVSEDFAYRIPEVFSDEEAAPLLCAGAVGYRSLRLCGMKDGDNIGLVGFGASAHVVISAVKRKYPNSRVFVFSRTPAELDFARELGAAWTGNIGASPPEKLHCAIDTTPAWKPVVSVLKDLEKGGRLVINAIRKEDTDKESLLGLDYARDLWLEKEIKSVANVTRKDVAEFLEVAAEIPIRPEVQVFGLEEANRVLLEIKKGRIRGAKVLKIG
ncbi:MAG: zinc-dependent alcohol dehydrogenase family protein [Candidatus Sulfobium sp.]|jgi:propanol-preferring alcohol dehydrogenase